MQQAKLVAPDGASFQQFGQLVAIDGDTAAIATLATLNNPPVRGAIYVFVRAGGAWTLQQKVVSPDGGPLFGTSIALRGDTLVAGGVAPNMMPSAYVFARSGTTWSATQTLVSSWTRAISSGFGVSAAIDGDTLLVGTTQEQVGYVFVRAGGAYALQAQLTTTGIPQYEELAYSVALSGDTAVLGDNVLNAASGGAAYVFARSGTTWTRQQKLVGIPGPNTTFGDAVALVGDTAVVADWQNIPYGRLYVYERSAGSWTKLPFLEATDATANDRLGWSAAMGQDIIVAGNLGNALPAGAVYVFRRASGEGEACTTGVTCHSGHCIDGVCCDTACVGGDPRDCQACSVTSGAATDGKCGPLRATAVCRASTGECDTDATCDGVNPTCPADVAKPNGTPCASGVCTGGTCGPAPDAAPPAGDAGPDASFAVDPPAAAGCACTAGARGDRSPVLFAALAAAARRHRRKKENP